MGVVSKMLCRNGIPDVPNEECGWAFDEFVWFAIKIKIDLATNSIPKVDLAIQKIGESRRCRILTDEIIDHELLSFSRDHQEGTYFEVCHKRLSP